MKLKSRMLAPLLLAGLMAGHANAAPNCTLSVSQSFVPIGQSFSFGININDFVVSPLPPDQFTVVFYGSKNGVNDLPYGYQQPGTVPYQFSTLGGYGNPGGVGGSYLRYAVVYKNGTQNGPYCVTNPVFTTLQ